MRLWLLFSTDTQPSLQLKQILEQLVKQYKSKETEMHEFQREYAS